MNIPQLRSPVVLVHGLLGFDELRVAGRVLASYFPGIPELLGEVGNRVLVPRMSMTSGVADRAAQIKAFLDQEVPHEPVHIFAHSMGGLDARYLISRLSMAPRVLSLTTIGTPHRGTAFADWGVRRLERVLKPFFELFDIPQQAFYDLTTHHCREFNEQTPDAPGVRYFSVAGRHEGEWRNAGWYIPHRIVKEAEGENDGVVSIKSATYGESAEVWDGDHLSLINWPYPNGSWENRATHYTGLVRRLADEGF